MNTVAVASVALVGLMLAGLAIAIFYGGLVILEMIKAFRVPVLPEPTTLGERDVVQDQPTRRFRGQDFERSWHGSQGYEQRPSRTADDNWVDRIVVSLIVPLRPTRFKDPSYWTRYLPSVAVVWLILFVVVPAAAELITQPTTGAIASFTPTSTQRSVAVPGAAIRVPRGTAVRIPSDCSRESVDLAATPLAISDTDDGTLFGVRPGIRVLVTAMYGHPLFSPGAPLCPDGRRNEYIAAGSGTGFIFFPEPTETMVAAIGVTISRANFVWSFVFVGIAVMVIDLLLVVLLRRVVHQRWTSSGGFWSEPPPAA